MNPVDLLYIVLLAFSAVLFLNKHRGKEMLFKVFYFWKRMSAKEYLHHEANPRFAKLWSCYFCQGAHVAHALSWCYGWWAGLSLMETCYLVFLATPVSAAVCEMVIGFFDDVQTLVGGASKINSPVNISDERMQKVTAPYPATAPTGKEGALTPKQAQSPNPLEAYVAERKKRGYDIDLIEGPDGKQSVMVKHVPERERLWEAFYSGKPPVEVPGLLAKWNEIKKQWEDEECTRCERNALLTERRDEVLKIIDAHLKLKNGDGKAGD